ncbi:MlaD family protein [Sedimentisphaera salicampi]|uniref:Paraquat-inducible protein B n=1 Tax=Sedimentisphaera salicampi TaxID=1941349 RepID=A0A1W6LJP8_9BACT|nr:MlaD family protein [Sedimentisphaera salicampi]ARN56011.1 paraquat-inducible protein B [Sedimentisphaera salicampi]OXU15924.1 paraquat-inducible protein B [Sedimentisphaera salicampi]
MSREPNYFNIGLFLLTAALLLVVGVVVFGTGAVGAKKIRMESYFDESIQGLSVGSPLKYRGVEIGRVESIDLASKVYSRQLKDEQINKYGKYVRVVTAVDPQKAPESLLDKDNLSETNLRVRVTAQGITGISFLDVDYFTPAEDYPVLEYSWEPEYKCIPSTESMMNSFLSKAEDIMKEFSKVEFGNISDELNSLLAKTNQAIDDARIKELSDNFITLTEDLTSTSENARNLIADLDESLKAGELKELQNSAIDTLEKIQASANEFDKGVASFDELCNNANVLLEYKESQTESVTVPELLQELRNTLTRIRTMAASNSRSIEKLIDNSKRLTDKLNDTAEKINQQPSTVIFSNPPEKSEVLK